MNLKKRDLYTKRGRGHILEIIINKERMRIILSVYEEQGKKKEKKKEKN